ncbi:MAG: hypothetical protein A3G24_22985 [Betaproteobacteria bacterium RIFCSPLOWO2_12_FULL_62_13]|nr:MAG: hypothetical protein A3G24_22985 [Betaproteobacteria bacterium RIFCSPLOWO2_12_FULL_62_13]
MNAAGNVIRGALPVRQVPAQPRLWSKQQPWRVKTAFVRRPHEYGRNKNPDIGDDPAFTTNAGDFIDRADQLGC